MATTGIALLQGAADRYPFQSGHLTKRLPAGCHRAVRRLGFGSELSAKIVSYVKLGQFEHWGRDMKPVVAHRLRGDLNPTTACGLMHANVGIGDDATILVANGCALHGLTGREIT
uniref:Uncharacterized protein n=1 Tax=Aureimonas altamirensis TaxID=370622 RepID=A0A0P0YVR1_9HYPH|nr:hypothetical protein [Aureimonas altamirensis]